MTKLINKRYHLEFDLPEQGFERWLAKDVVSPSDEYVQVYRVVTSRASDFVHDLVQSRCRELATLAHPYHVPLLDHGYDATNSCYFFVYPQVGGKQLRYYIKEAQPPLMWSYRILNSLAGFLEYLHNRNIPHGSLQGEHIILNDAADSILVARTGIAPLISFVSGNATTGVTSIEAAKLADTRSFKQLLMQLLTRNPDPTEYEVKSLLETAPAVLQQGLLQADSFPSFSEIRKSLQQVERELESQKVYRLRLTGSVVNKLHEAGFLPQPVEGLASHYLQQEMERGVFAWAQTNRQRDGREYLLTTSQMQLWAVPDGAPVPHGLVLTGMNVRTPGDLATARARGLRIGATLRIETRSTSGTTRQGATVKPLLDEIEAHIEKTTQVRQKEEEDKNQVIAWRAVLTKQQQLLREFQIPYHSWTLVDSGSAVEVQLGGASREPSIALSQDDPLCLTTDDRRQRPVGYFEDLTGNTLKIGLSRNFNPEQFKPSGILTVDNAEVETLINRQQDAIKRFVQRETANPRLLPLLSQPEKVTLEAAPAIDLWFQPTLDESQKKAVRRALATRDIFLIQGPPGTGKTSVIAELVLQILQRDDHARILITSQSNVAVNHALTRIMGLRPDLASSTVRVGREEKAGSTEVWLLDRQLHAWGNSVITRSEHHLKALEERASGGQALVNALGLLAECQAMTNVWEERATELATAQAKLTTLDAEYQAFEQALREATHLRQRAEAILASASAQDVRLKQTLGSFQSEYLGWASAFLERAEKVAALSFQRVEALEQVSTLEVERERLNHEIEAGRQHVNDFLQAEFQCSFPTIGEQQRFLDQHYVGKREEMARLGRIQRLLEEWKPRVGRNQDDFATAYLSSRCKIVGATCIGVASRSVSDIEFDWVIVDEAGRATSPEMLVPLVRGRKLVLVGDHRQLPPIISRDLDEAIGQTEGASREALNISLFQYLMGSINPDAQIALEQQYRMHPHIGKLISACFYADRLSHGVEANARRHALPWYSRPVVWLSTKGLPNAFESKAPGSHSLLNQAEIDVILQLLDRIQATYQKSNVSGKTLGVITGYQGQKAALRAKISAGADRWSQLGMIEVDTVDAYQGRERDIIIYSVVRNNPERKLGFLSDERRLNVALSRAKELLVIVGNTDVEYASGMGGNPFQIVLQHMRRNAAECEIRKP